MSKKSWHTKNLNNQEKVWIAEERAKDEKVKTSELAKQIQQEREEDELGRIAGHASKKLDRGIDWMYTGHSKNSETAQHDAAQQAEEYLLGKSYNPVAAAGDFSSTGQGKEGVNAVVAGVQGKDEYHQNSVLKSSMMDDNASADATAGMGSTSLHPDDSVYERNETFRKRHEDPMYEVSLQRLRQEKALEHRKELYERAGFAIVPQDDAPQSQSTDKREEKRKETHKKSKKKHSKRQYDDSSDESSAYDRKHQSKHRKSTRHRSSPRDQREKNTIHRFHDDVEDDSSDSRRGRKRRRKVEQYKRDNRRSYSENSASDCADKEPVKKDRRRHDRRANDAGKDSMRSDGKRARREERKLHEPRANKSDERKVPPTEYSDDDDTQKKRHAYINGRDRRMENHRPTEYGLQGGKQQSNPPSRSSRYDGLGPDRDLLLRKDRERDSEKQRMREVTSTRRTLSLEEKKAAVRAMERDAVLHAAGRRQPHQQSHRRVEEEESNKSRLPCDSFLHELTKRAHGI